jgi:hypothetical protein
MVFASSYDQSRFLKAADLSGEKKFRIKSVTEEEIGIGKDKERKLVVWFTNESASSGGGCRGDRLVAAGNCANAISAR